MNAPYQMPVGTLLDKQLGFNALSVYVENPTNLWVLLPELGIRVPPLTIGAIYPIPATQRGQASFSAPIGVTAAATIAGQFATIIFYDMQLPSSAGAPAIGPRTPYYDRNPLSVGLNYSGTIGAHGVTQRWIYTVPAGRRAYLEAIQASVQIQTAGGGRKPRRTRFCGVSCSSKFTSPRRIGRQWKSTPNATVVPTLVDIAWAAGIYEGEGSVRRNVSAGVVQKDTWILHRLVELFGGTISMPRIESGCSVWYVHGGRARGFLTSIYPFLSPRRQEQIKFRFDELQAKRAAA